MTKESRYKYSMTLLKLEFRKLPQAAILVDN